MALQWLWATIQSLSAGMWRFVMACGQLQFGRVGAAYQLVEPGRRGGGNDVVFFAEDVQERLRPRVRVVVCRGLRESDER